MEGVLCDLLNTHPSLCYDGGYERSRCRVAGPVAGVGPLPGLAGLPTWIPRGHQSSAPHAGCFIARNLRLDVRRKKKWGLAQQHTAVPVPVFRYWVVSVLLGRGRAWLQNVVQLQGFAGRYLIPGHR